MSSTPQVMKKRKTTDDELGLDETTKSSPTTTPTTPRRILSAVSSWLNRSTSPSSSSKLKNNSNVQQQHQRPTPTPKNTPAINRNRMTTTNEETKPASSVTATSDRNSMSNLKPEKLEMKLNNRKDVYYQFGQQPQPKTKYFKPSPPSSKKRITSTSSSSKEKENRLVPHNNTNASSSTTTGKNTMFSRFQQKSFTIGTASNLPLYRRKPLKLEDPSSIFRSLDKIDEDFSFVNSNTSKINQPTAVKRIKISKYSDPRWVVPSSSSSIQKFKKDENKPVNVKNDAEVEQKFIFDLDDVGECEVWNFIEATISSHNKGEATATKSKSSISKNDIYVEKNVSQPDDGGWGANMFMQEDEWKCEGCSGINKNTHNKCQSCRMPRDATSYEGVKLDDDDAGNNDDRSGSTGAISATGFSFGAATTTTTQPTPSSDKKRKSDYDNQQQQSSKSLFTFGGSATAATTTTPGTGFTFDTKQNKEDATKPKSTVFSFGAAPPKTETINILKSPSTNENAKGPVFKFGDKKSKFSSSDASTKKSNVTFASNDSATATPATKRKSDDESNKSTAFSTPSAFGGKSTSNNSDMKTTPDATSTKPSFSFGAATKTKARADTPAPPRTNGSGLFFGASKETNTKSEGTSSATAPSDTTTAGAGFANATAVKKIKSDNVPAPPTTNFSFGTGTTTSQPPASTSTTSAPSFTFGQKSNSDLATTGTAAVTPSFTFGQKTNNNPDTTSTAAPAPFGASSQPLQSSAGPAASASTPTFPFGQTSKQLATASTLAPFGASAPVSTTPSFSFGQKPKSETTASAPPGPTPFGTSSTTSQQQPFGGTTTNNNPFGANLSNNAPASFAPAPFGGTNNNAVSASATASFGAANNTMPASAPFGTTTNPSTAFGSAAPSTNAPPFGAAPSTNATFQTTNFGGGATAPPFNPQNPSFPQQQQAPQAINFGASNAGGFNTGGPTAPAFGAAGNATSSFGAGAGAATGGFSMGTGPSQPRQGKRRLIRARRPPGASNP